MTWNNPIVALCSLVSPLLCPSITSLPPRCSFIVSSCWPVVILSSSVIVYIYTLHRTYIQIPELYTCTSYHYFVWHEKQQFLKQHAFYLDGYPGCGHRHLLSYTYQWPHDAQQAYTVRQEYPRQQSPCGSRDGFPLQTTCRRIHRRGSSCQEPVSDRKAADYVVCWKCYARRRKLSNFLNHR